MKKLRVVFAVAFLISFLAVSAQQHSIIRDILQNSVTEKVDMMQQLIKFDEIQAKQLEDIELDHLLKVQKAENCCLCNTKRRKEKLQLKRDEELQKILTREQYIKYIGIEKERIRKGVLIAQ